MNILELKRLCRGFTLRGGEGGGEGGGGTDTGGGKPGESNMANAAAGLGSAPAGTNENSAYEGARAAEAAQGQQAADVAAQEAAAKEATQAQAAFADAQTAANAQSAAYSQAMQNQRAAEVAAQAQSAAYAQEAQNQRAAEAAAQAKAQEVQAAAPAVQAKPGEDLMAQAAASTPAASSLDAALAAMAPVDYSLSPTSSTASRKGLGLTASSSGTVGEANLSPTSTGLAGMGLGLTAADLGLEGVGRGGFKGPDYSKADTYSLTNAPAQTYSDLHALEALGMGKLQLNDTYNQSQTVEQAIAAKNVHEFLNATVPALAGMMVPAGIPSLAWGVVSGITSGKINSVTDAIGSLATSMIAGKLGIPAGALDAALKGNLGQAAASMAMSELSKTLAGATGLPGSVIGAVGSATGATKGLQSGISGLINDIPGVSGANAAISGVRGGVSGALGNLGSGKSGGGAGVTGKDSRGDLIAGTETGTKTETPAAITTPGAVNTAIPSYDTAGSYGSYGTTQSSTAADLAKIGYYYDPFGESIIPLPKTNATPTPDVLKSLYGTGRSVRAAEGGSIDDLMEYLRS